MTWLDVGWLGAYCLILFDMCLLLEPLALRVWVWFLTADVWIEQTIMKIAYALRRHGQGKA